MSIAAGNTSSVSQHCFNIAAPEHGFVNPTAIQEFGTVRFWCEPGYMLVGYSRAMCENGKVLNTPKCIGVL